MAWCAAEEPNWVGILDCDLEDAATAISFIIDGSRVKTRAAHLTWRAEVTRDSRVNATEEMKLENVVDVCGSGVWAE